MLKDLVYTYIYIFNNYYIVDFIDNRAKCYDGVLQKFIDPKGAYNSTNIYIYIYIEVIKIAWSPQLCMAEIRCNRRPLYEKKYDIYERALTYEGPGFYSNVCNILRI